MSICKSNANKNSQTASDLTECLMLGNFRVSGHFNVRRAYDYDALLCFRI